MYFGVSSVFRCISVFTLTDGMLTNDREHLLFDREDLKKYLLHLIAYHLFIFADDTKLFRKNKEIGELYAFCQV